MLLPISASRVFHRLKICSGANPEIYSDTGWCLRAFHWKYNRGEIDMENNRIKSGGDKWGWRWRQLFPKISYALDFE